MIPFFPECFPFKTTHTLPGLKLYYSLIKKIIRYLYFKEIKWENCKYQLAKLTHK